MIHVFGDSNARCFESMPNSKVFSFSGCTMYQIAMLGLEIADTLDSHCNSIFMFGAIDSRKHIAKLQSQITIDQLAEQFILRISEFCKKNTQTPIVAAVIPESHIPDEHNKDHFRAIGSLEERIDRNLTLNSTLQRHCHQHKINFIDPYQYFRTSIGALDPSKEDTNNICHVAPQFFEVIHGHFQL